MSAPPLRSAVENGGTPGWGRSLLRLLLLLLPLAAALFGYTVLQLQHLQVRYRLDDLERELRQLHVEERRLRVEVARREAPARIESRAREELGMEILDLGRTVEIGAEVGVGGDEP